MKNAVTLTARESAELRELLGRAQREAQGNLRLFNLCRRAAVILDRARRRLRLVHYTNPLLLDNQVINDIFTW